MNWNPTRKAGYHNAAISDDKQFMIYKFGKWWIIKNLNTSRIVCKSVSRYEALEMLATKVGA